ncbi:hypothetical protein Poli38472_003507 [Pythium oligandrum]|uniref:Intradiol ring-cleavage dioxygenases domain-containing protein n=1 Tax=Pythium oligandrum TaxID=41045 RepID=A0A8K1C7S8_PYTOL|nr:hypothetical protein Poli38472_003507 [Pythium oligandrum]|eukprot:TMW57582.1 hypothetical protein Poli38472_003507 [Pythium oligandrum]
MLTQCFYLAFTALAVVSAHPGQHHDPRSLAEVAQRRLFQSNTHRLLQACANSKNHRVLQERAAARREAKLNELRTQRRLSAADVIATSHKSNLTNITTSVDSAKLFGTQPKCVLEPEVTQGPYYVNGELIRSDIREKQAGVDLYTELQIIDVNTCEPVADLYIDFWHCNSTGVYSGVVANGNGNSADASNINATFARGLAPTDKDGIVQFITKFPGHYMGRATHIHILSNHGGSVLANKTYSGSSVSSVGQIFFDQDLITEVEKTDTYAKNSQTLTTNEEDNIFAQEAASGFDPVVQYVYLGSSVDDGIFSWISIGIDASESKTVSAAATLTANGGVASGTTGGFGGRGNSPGTSTDSSTPSSSNVGTPAPSSAPPQAFTASAFAVLSMVVTSIMFSV